MANCPKCEKGISNLTYVSKTETWQEYAGEGEYGAMGVGDLTHHTYDCPKCNETLCYSETEADKILNPPSNHEGRRNIDQEVETFINSIKDVWKEEPLDGDETQAIANRILAELDNANGNE